MNSLTSADQSLVALSENETAIIVGGGATAFGTKSYYQDGSGNVWEDEYFCDWSPMIGSYCMWESDKY